MQKKNSQAMRSRGFVATTDILNYEHLSDSQIVNLLQSNLATHYNTPQNSDHT